MFAIRVERDYVIEEDFMKAARKIKESKKLESKMDYSKVWDQWLILYKVIHWKLLNWFTWEEYEDFDCCDLYDS